MAALFCVRFVYSFMTGNQCRQSSYIKICRTSNSRRVFKFQQISRISRSCRHPDPGPILPLFSPLSSSPYSRREAAPLRLARESGGSAVSSAAWFKMEHRLQLHFTALYAWTCYGALQIIVLVLVLLFLKCIWLQHFYFFGQGLKWRPPKIGGPVRPNTSNMSKKSDRSSHMK